MPQTQIRGNTQIIPGTVPNSALDTTTVGSSVATRIQTSSATRLTMSQTGADTGTGVVTLDLATTGVGAGTYTKVTIDVYGRVTTGASLSASDLPAGSASYIQNQSSSAQTASLWIDGTAHLGQNLELESYVPGTTTNKLYNNAGALSWNGYGVLTTLNTTSYGRGFLNLADSDAALVYATALGIAPINDMAYMSGWADGKNIDVSYDSVNRTVTLSHASGFLRGYWKGRSVTIPSPWTSAPHAVGFGSYFLYSTDGSNITWSLTPWNFRHLHVAYVRYTATIKAGIREPHGLMDPDIHESLHVNVGAWIKSGGTLTVGTYAVGAPESDANNTPGVDSVVVSDEDSESTLAALPQGNYTRVYVDNAGAGVYALGSAFPFSHTPGGFINYYVNGVETQGSQNNYYCIYGIAVPVTSDATSQAYRWLWMQAQKVYSTIDLARAESISSLALGDLLTIFPECAPRIKLIYRASAAYVTTGKVRLEEFSYITKTLNISSAGTTTSSWSTLSDIPTSIKALADVIPAADALPYFNSTTTATTTALTAYGRGLIGVANEASAYTYLNLSNNYVARSGSTMTGLLVMNASTAGSSGFRLVSGVDPTAPVTGDMWSTGANVKYYDGTTKQTFAYTSYVDEAIHHRTTGVADPVPPALTNNNNATLTVASANVTLNHASDFTGSYSTFLVTGTTLATTPGTEQYLCVRYNAGAPNYYIENNKANINSSDVVCIYVVWTVGTEVHSISCDSRGLGLSNKIASMLTQTKPYSIAVDSSLTPSETSVPTPRTILVSSALVYAGTDAQQVVGFNSSSVNHRLTLVYHVAGTWTFRNDTVYDNLNIDNGTNLVALNNSKFAVRWLYRTIGDDTQVFYVLGSGEYNSVDAARQEALPTNLPVVVRNHSILIGRLIVGQAASSGVIDPVATTTFNTQGITDHNALSNLQGGTASNQYYHLNSAQYTYLTGLSSSSYIQNQGASAQTANMWISGNASATAFRVYNGSYYTAVTAGTQAGNLSLALPTTAGSNKNFLQTNGAGVTSWATITANELPGIVGTFGNLANGTGMLYNAGNGTLTWVPALAIASTTQSFTDFGQVGGSNPTINTTANNIGIGFTDNRGVNWRGGFVSTATHFGFAQDANDTFTDLKPFVIFQAGANAYQLNPTGTLRHRFLGGINCFGDISVSGSLTINTSSSGVVIATAGVLGLASAGFNALSLTTAATDKVPYYTSATTASTMTVTAFARTLLDDADASSFLTTLGAASTSHAATHYFGGSDVIAGQSLSGLRVTDQPFFGAVSSALPGNDGVGAGPFLRVMNDRTTPTEQWLLQLGANGNLAFWNRPSSGSWALRWNFLTDGTLRQGTIDRVTPTGGLRVEDITATYLKVTAPNTGLSYVNIDFNGGTTGNRRMSYRWDDVNDRLDMFTSNDDGSSRSARLRIPRSDALPLAITYGLTVSSGNLNISGLTASSIVATDSSKNLVSYTLVANDIPSIDWSKITTGKPTTLSGYGITNGTAKNSSTVAFDTVANNWYRVASSVVGVGRNSGEFYLRWSVSGNHGTARFTATCHYNRIESLSIQQSEYGKYIGGITKARIVYYSGVYSLEYCYLEVMFDVSLTGVSVTQELREGSGWVLGNAGDAGSIPVNYTTYEHTFVKMSDINAGSYAKVTFNKEGRVTAGSALAAGDLPGVTSTLAGLANAQGVLYNSGAGVLTWNPALPIDSYSRKSFSNFGVNGTSAYAYGIQSNNGIGFEDTRGVSWRAGFVTTDAYFGITQDATLGTDFKPFILAGGTSNGTYYKMDPNDTSFRHYLTGATRVSSRMTIGTATNKTGALDVDGGSIRNYVDANVQALLHFDGRNGSRQFIDVAGNRWVGGFLADGNHTEPFIETSASKFGGGSLLNTTTQFVRFEGSSFSHFNVNAGSSFTVELQVYFNTALTAVFFDFGPSTTGIRAQYVPGTGVQVTIQNTTRTFAWSPTTATWYHFAVIRNGTNLFVCVNGSQIGTSYTSNESITVTRTPLLCAGSDTVGVYFGMLEGRIDEFRYMKAALSTSTSFTAPTAAYDYGTFTQVGVAGVAVNGPGQVLVADGLGNASFQQPRRTMCLQFALAEDVINTSVYFHSWHGGTGARSGSTSGLWVAGACSPIVVPFAGRITRAALTVGRLGVNFASVSYPCFLQTVLNFVGFSTETNASKTAANLNFSVEFSPVGAINGVNCTAELTNLNVLVTAGDCLALKFVNGSSATTIGMVGSAFVSLTLEEVM